MSDQAEERRPIDEDIQHPTPSRKQEDEEKDDKNVRFEPRLKNVQPVHSNKNKDLIAPILNTKLYKRRWWILFVFSALTLLQSFVGITWITIQQSAKDVFSWKDSNLIILTHCKTIAFVIFGIPACCFLKRIGIRNNVLLANTFLFTGIGIRCAMQNIQIAKLLIYISQILVGTAGVVITGSSSLVSSIWFPVKQRTTITTIFNLCNYVGIYLGFLIGPIVIDLSTLSPCRDAKYSLIIIKYFGTRYSRSLL
ncbi:disrupted in renal carcinoma protein 2 homolog [Centruroides sculpturatus]|uniref:disrupted in renal carcinoma protein 2 homolog n=1 Tax=Centruroides sculpturatus TaxID=218467 RepID=UPI000C6E1FF4|nr:disrupted in renal carcinoma protein 2 homolog [Centruroides sculpturatus]